MLRFLCIIVLMALIANGLHPDKCQRFPKEKHCLIEYSVRYRWPHQIRYVYNWYTKLCFEVRWSDNCPPPPADTNNFASEQNCSDQCGGWA